MQTGQISNIKENADLIKKDAIVVPLSSKLDFDTITKELPDFWLEV